MSYILLFGYWLSGWISEWLEWLLWQSGCVVASATLAGSGWVAGALWQGGRVAASATSWHSGWVAEWLRQSHQSMKWTDQILNISPCHSARVARAATQPLCQSGWRSHSATQPLGRSGWRSSHSATHSLCQSGWSSHSATQQLCQSGCESLCHSVTLPEWLEQPLSLQPLSHSEWLMWKFPPLRVQSFAAGQLYIVCVFRSNRLQKWFRFE